jgi:hypothetical protein
MNENIATIIIDRKLWDAAPHARACTLSGKPCNCWKAKALSYQPKGDKEKLAAFMIAREYATGHGDTMDDLLKELSEQLDSHEQFTIEMQRERIRIAITKLHCFKDKLSMRRLIQIEDIIATLEGTKP